MLRRRTCGNRDVCIEAALRGRYEAYARRSDPGRLEGSPEEGVDVGGLIVLPEDVEAEKARRVTRQGMWTVRLAMLGLLGLLGAALAFGLDLLG
jgi:hypothetical protein